MSPRIVLFLAAVGLVATSPLRGEAPFERGDAAPLANWTAAPFWQPEARAEMANAREAFGTLAVTPVDPGPLPFVALSPCRVADTRGNGFSGFFGPPAFTAGGTRAFPLAGQCGIPASARAVSLNFVVTNTAGPGFLGAYPQGSDYPGVASLTFSAGQTLANAAIVPLSSGGGMTVVAGVSGFDLIIDVNGYYANPNTASSGAYDARQLAMLRWYEAARPYTPALATGGMEPWGMTFDGIYLWVLHRGGIVKKILPATNTVVGTYTVQSSVEGNLAFDGVSVWAASAGSVGQVSRIKVSDGSVMDVPLVGVNNTYGIAYDGSAVWVGAAYKLLKLNPSDGTVLATVTLPYGNPRDVIFDGTYVWVAGNNATAGKVTRVLASNPATTVEFSTGGAYPTGLVFDGANVWITNFSSASVTKMRASDGFVMAIQPVGTEPRGLVFDGVNIWVGCQGSSDVYKLRAATAQQVGSPIPISWGVNRLGFDGSSVWVGGGFQTGYLGKL